MRWYEIAVALLAAVGGTGGVLQLIRTARAWRDGVRQREDAAEERLVRRLEKRVDLLEARAAEDAAYQAALMTAIAQAGGAIPPRPLPKP